MTDISFLRVEIKQKSMDPAVERPQSLGEEIANSVSHGAGLLLLLLFMPILLLSASHQSAVSSYIGTIVFTVTSILLYLSSTLFHALPRNKAKRVFQILDHSSIFLLIAGTYTPFTLGVLRGPWGWTLFGVVWTLAILGVVFKSIGGVRYNKLSTCIYLMMGWLIVVAIKPALVLIPPAGLLWLLLGGIAYTGGVLFFVFERKRYFHFLWHLFVILGTSCHCVAVLRYST